METKACDEKEGAWSFEEDEILMNYVQVHGEGYWSDLPKRTGLNRCGRSCKLRWLNYLKPTNNRGNISSDEEELIIKLHNLLGNRWSIIAGRFPGRTENEIENFWNTYLSKKVGEKNNNSKLPSSSITTTTKIDPSEFPHPVIKPKAVRLTKPIYIMPAQIG